MALWMVRGGKAGQQEVVAVENNIACVKYHEVPDLTPATSTKEVRKIVEAAFPEAFRPVDLRPFFYTTSTSTAHSPRSFQPIANVTA